MGSSSATPFSTQGLTAAQMQAILSGSNPATHDDQVAIANAQSSTNTKLDAVVAALGSLGALRTDYILNGTSQLPVKTLKMSVAISALGSLTDTSVIPAVTGKKIRVVSATMSGAGVGVSVTFNTKGSGVGIAITPAYLTVIATPLVFPMDSYGLMTTNVGEALSFSTGQASVAASVGLLIKYVEV